MSKATIIGLDIGYGYTKAVGDGALVTFPSVVGQAEKIRYESDLAARNGRRDIHLVTGEGERFVGALALLQSRVKWTPRERDRATSTLATLAQAAFSELGASGEVRLVTGLPVEWYSDRDKLAGQLRGRHAIRRVDGECATVEVVDVLVVPQPFGSFFALILDERGAIANEELARGRVGVLDIGVYTTDFILADCLRYVEPASGSLTTAMARVYELVGRAIQDTHGLRLDLHQVDQALRAGSVSVYGAPQDISGLVAPHLDAVANEILSKAGTLWGDARDLAAVLVTGGGALALGERVARRYPHALVVPDANTANVRGFHRYGRRKWAGV